MRTEYEYGASPTDPDSDDDGLTDAAEINAGTHPWRADSDGDGLPDGDEVARGSDPLDARDIPYVPHVVINEVLYYPTNQTAWRNQFIELFNPCDHDVDL